MTGFGRLITSLVGVATAISQFDSTHVISAIPSSCAVLGLAIAVCYSQQLWGRCFSGVCKYRLIDAGRVRGLTRGKGRGGVLKKRA